MHGIVPQSQALLMGMQRVCDCSYPAELRAEVYYPWYFSRARPVIRSVNANNAPHAYGSSFTVSVQVTGLNQGTSAAQTLPTPWRL